MPHSLVLNLLPESPIPPGFTSGKHLHALFLSLVSSVDADMGNQLHANQANKSFTLSPLQVVNSFEFSVLNSKHSHPTQNSKLKTLLHFAGPTVNPSPPVLPVGGVSPYWMIASSVASISSGSTSTPINPGTWGLPTCRLPASWVPPRAPNPGLTSVTTSSSMNRHPSRSAS